MIFYYIYKYAYLYIILVVFKFYIKNNKTITNDMNNINGTFSHKNSKEIKIKDENNEMQDNKLKVNFHINI